MRRVVLFDDGRGRLSPLSDLRPAFDVRTGALTTRERLLRSYGWELAGVVVPPELEALTRSRESVPVNSIPSDPPTGELVLLNGRCPFLYEEVVELDARVGALVESQTGDLIAALASPETARRIAADGFKAPAAGGGAGQRTFPALLSRPWHVRTFRDRAVTEDLDLLCESMARADASPQQCIRIGDHDLAVHPAARVYPGVVLDLEHGAIVIDEGAVVRPASTIIGPAYIGPHSLVADRAIIKAFTAMGPHCKVGGEVGATIFQGYANKVHDGHLGDSWVGEWANIGAGTTNSNLLNTYDHVTARAWPGGPTERTGEMFLGCIVGDHVKTSIGTRIMTGAIIGTGTMFAAGAPAAGFIPAFSWITDQPAGAGAEAGAYQLRPYRLDKFIEVARTMMGRRRVQPSSQYLDRIRSLHSRRL
jgi:UDP-N-acetylglucosamine diphosphorylase/glucosamine-1-phosphate N-acetyltransferase